MNNGFNESGGMQDSFVCVGSRTLFPIPMTLTMMLSVLAC